MSPGGTHIPATRGWWQPSQSTRQQPQQRRSPCAAQPQADMPSSEPCPARPPRDQHVISCVWGSGVLDPKGAGWRPGGGRGGALKSQEMSVVSSNQQFSVKTKGRSARGPVLPPRTPLKHDTVKCLFLPSLRLLTTMPRVSHRKKEPKHAPVRREDKALSGGLRCGPRPPYHLIVAGLLHLPRLYHRPCCQLKTNNEDCSAESFRQEPNSVPAEC